MTRRRLGISECVQLASDWKLVTPAAATGGVDPSQTNIAGSATSVVQGTPVTFTLTVSSATTQSTATPTGSVQITVDSIANGSAVTLAAGTGALRWRLQGISVGNHVVQATYSGDNTFAGSKGAFALTVTATRVPGFCTDTDCYSDNGEGRGDCAGGAIYGEFAWWF